MGGVVAARTGDDPGTVTHRLEDGTQQVGLLGVGGGRRLARGAADDDAVVAVVHEVLRQLLGPVEVEGPVRAQRGDHGRENAAEG